MSERGTSTGLPIAWEWCKRHDWKSEKVVCPFCRAERAESDLLDARMEITRLEGIILRLHVVARPLAGSRPARW